MQLYSIKYKQTVFKNTFKKPFMTKWEFIPEK